MSKVTTHEKIKSVRASEVPGDTLQKLIAPMRDTDGKLWPVGTTFRSQAAGHDSISGQDYRGIHIISAATWEG